MPKYNARHIYLGSKPDGIYEDTKEPRIRDMLACAPDGVVERFYKSSPPETQTEPSCPECSKYWAKLKLKALKEAGIELTTEKAEEPKKRYKTFELVRRNGEPVGYIAFLHGFGGTWQTFPLSLRDATAPVEYGGGYPTKYNDNAVSRTQHSREAALLNAEKLVAEGKLPSEASLRTAIAEREANMREARWVREKREAEAQQKREQERCEEVTEIDEMLEGLRSALDRTDSNLSNYERDSIGRAVSRFMAQRDRIASGG